ncbi:hypothetical protein G5I_01476 [Acromyrmex echinatior]|uniref:Uncharacterized protein n=1 Tax=Acromyrmex echinatior TaxID=103372 RepID=F4W7Q5_ACREC|nr:hypothetical protein G5I_01476 [Acromyrmex echinatior]
MVQTKFAGFREIYLMVTLNLTLRSTLGITQGQSTVLQIRVHRFLKIPNYQDLEQSMPPVSALPKMYHVEVTRSDLHLVGGGTGALGHPKTHVNNLTYITVNFIIRSFTNLFFMLLIINHSIFGFNRTSYVLPIICDLTRRDKFFILKVRLIRGSCTYSTFSLSSVSRGEKTYPFLIPYTLIDTTFKCSNLEMSF